MAAAARTGKGRTAEIAGEILTFLGEAGIDAALSAFTGGALAAAKLGSKGKKVAGAADDVWDVTKKSNLPPSKAKRKIEKISKNNIIKIDMQFFSESDLKNQSSNSLKKGIKKLDKRIEEHKYKISYPERYDEEWSSRSVKEQEGLKKHWKKEISNFQESLNNRIEELKKRGDNYDV